MRRSIIGQVELRRSAAAEAAVSAAVRHRGVGRAAAERAPLPRHGRMGRGGWEEIDRAAWAVVFTTSPRSAHVATAAGRSPGFPQRLRVDLVNREDRSLTVPGAEAALSRRRPDTVEG